MNYVYRFKAYFVLLFGFLLFFSSCKEEPPLPNFSLKNGVWFLIHKFENSEERIFTPGDYYTADIQYKTIDDSIFHKTRRELQIFEPEFEGSIETCFSMLQAGDSASFIISADDFFERTLKDKLPSFFRDSSQMVVTINVLDVKTSEQYENEKQVFLSWINDFEEYEDVNLKQFLQNENVDLAMSSSGMYSMIVEEGIGKKINYGDTITIHYRGWFLNGKNFDSTWERNQPFTFVYGTEWQVVKGIEEALGKMTEGEKSIFIMPSKLAFGYSGSSTGIIPPFTPVIYEVEMVKVSKKNATTQNDTLN